MGSTSYTSYKSINKIYQNWKHYKRKKSFRSGELVNLKGHGNEADFLGFLQKLGPHWSLTLPFEPFCFWLRIRRDIRNRKTTPRLAESGSRHGESGSRYSNFLKFSVDFPDFKRLNQPFKRSIWQKRSQGCNVLSPLIYLKVWKKNFL